MNKKILATTAIILVATAFAFTRFKNMTALSDFRDAVVDEIPGADKITGGMTYPVPEAEKVEPSAEEVTGLTRLIETYLELKREMEFAEIRLGQNEQSLRDAMSHLQKCHEIAKRFNSDARWISNTPKNRNTIAAAKLLRFSVGEATADNDNPPPVLLHLYEIGKKSPELKIRTEPHNELMFKIMDELAEGGAAIRAFLRP